ncbi:MAG: amidophosphoribosyltransferase [Bacteroidetes bacterium]|nr:amidophosphoribosyltransferase [Bacteroidota bacterium]MDA0879753.1 amidophosphoribosyltransferase [Bacteroidota bacterium]MDA1115741.1 amidophosphoribosyltransferase [Bacteroidota bacterium]
MSDVIKHECGIALVRLLKPLSFYQQKYGSSFYGINKMYLMLEKQHNRGQDGAGFASIKLDVSPGQRFISRVRSNEPQPIKDIFSQINGRINQSLEEDSTLINDTERLKATVPYLGELMLGHLRYGTFGKNSIESVHPFLRQNNWMHRNLIIAGNFNMTNVKELFQDLVDIGQHPKDYTDTVTVMENIGHFLDDAVLDLYYDLKQKGYDKKAASPLICDQMNVGEILKLASKKWDGGYAIAGLIGHGDAFVLRDPSGIRPAYFYQDDEVVVVASERPAIQTVFNVSQNDIREIDPGHALIIKKNGLVSITEINTPLPRKACSFERIYFSRGNDADIYQERKKLGQLLLPQVMKAIDDDIMNTVFSYIPNTAEISFFGMVETVERILNNIKADEIIAKNGSLTTEQIQNILNRRPRIEKIAVKDVKLRTFITQDSSRDDLVAHVYDSTYGVIKPTDNLVIIDDSIVRGTTLKKSILRILGRLHPKQIVVVSSAPQIRYPDCYGIDMANLGDLIAFRAMLALLEDHGKSQLLDEVYQKCKSEVKVNDRTQVNHVKELYASFSPEMISNKIAELINPDKVECEVKVIFQTIENLHIACPENLGDWYFTGNYPTPGGHRVVNQALINFVEGSSERAY